MEFKQSEFREVSRQEFYYFLKNTPGLHNWTFPGMWGCTDSNGVCHGFLVTKPEEIKFYLNVQDRLL